ncbi:MAG: histidine phosphatase family protein, partial [Clostridia bacterium]|nr:histidine phosphatase family protein [Clostridia bacterium]
MLIYLVRHGQTVFNTQGRIQGQQDSPLTETGIATTQKTALALKDKGITTIVSSCLGRAQQTSQILAQNLGAKIVLDERLNEIRLTPWEGRRKQDLIKENNQEYISYITKPHQYTSTQCEEFGHLMQRTYACLCDVVERYKG